MRTACFSFDQLAIDRVELPQHSLDLKTKTRTNLFPWRGQFSPELVDLLLSTYCTPGAIVLDPFAGVGTTLMEAARKQLSCFGTEVNPAAVAMAETVLFLGMNSQQRLRVLRRVHALISREFPTDDGPLFGGAQQDIDIPYRLADMASRGEYGEAERSVLTNLLIRLCEVDNPTADAVLRAFRQHADIIENLPHSTEKYVISNSDARALPLVDSSVDLVVTSPPYINVFNYHQNNRRAMELLGWDLLHVAKSEFGSNRKHRGNRFLTVIQYCLDMEATLLELRRVMKRRGRAIFIVGRESCVRGVAFENGSLVGMLAEQCGFVVSLRQERKFKNKFGALIYEDLLHLTPVENQHNEQSAARQIAVDALSSRLSVGLKPEVADDLRSAISQASEVKQSPLYVSTPGTRASVA